MQRSQGQSMEVLHGIYTQHSGKSLITVPVLAQWFQNERRVSVCTLHFSKIRIQGTVTCTVNVLLWESPTSKVKSLDANETKSEHAENVSFLFRFL